MEERAIQSEQGLPAMQFLREVARQLKLYRQVYENPTTWLSARQLDHIKSWLPRLRSISMDSSVLVNLREVAVQLGHGVRRSLTEHRMPLDDLWVPPDVGAIKAAVQSAAITVAPPPAGSTPGAAPAAGGAPQPHLAAGGAGGAGGLRPGAAGGVGSEHNLYTMGMLSNASMFTDAVNGSGGRPSGGVPQSLVHMYGGDNHSTRLLKVCKMIQLVDGSRAPEAAPKILAEDWQIPCVSVVPPRGSYHRPR